MPVLVRSVKLKLPKDSSLIKTIRLHSRICQYICDVGFSNKTYEKLRLHNLVYRSIKGKCPNFPSTLIQSAIGSASCMLKRAGLGKRMKVRPYSSMRLDKKTLRVDLNYHYASIASAYGRVRLHFESTPMLLKYKTWKPITGTLSCNQGQLYLNLVLVKKKPVFPKTISAEDVLGMDRGINNILVCSNNSFFNSKHLKKVKGKYQYLRKVLQSKGTRSAKRKLKKIRGRERRFVSDVNHCLSKKISQSRWKVFALENLKRMTNKKLGKRFNRKLGGWSFNGFERLLGYKCDGLGKRVVLVDASYSSQRCSKCGHTEKANRRGSDFRCKKCGFALHADLNASRNIANLGISGISRLRFNQPNAAL